MDVPGAMRFTPLLSEIRPASHTDLAGRYGAEVPEEDGALRFAERLLALLHATRYSATYKLAALVALIDVTAQRTGPDGTAPDTVSAKEVGRRVIGLSGVLLGVSSL